VFIEVDVSAGANSPLQLTRMFDAMEMPRPVSWVVTAHPEGNDRACEVTGWSSQGPCPAYAALVEDSGEGVAMLVYGGDEGIRLRATGTHENWDVHSPRQWGEACLLLDKDVSVG